MRNINYDRLRLSQIQSFFASFKKNKAKDKEIERIKSDPSLVGRQHYDIKMQQDDKVVFSLVGLRGDKYSSSPPYFYIQLDEEDLEYFKKKLSEELQSQLKKSLIDEIAWHRKSIAEAKETLKGIEE